MSEGLIISQIELQTVFILKTPLKSLIFKTSDSGIGFFLFQETGTD